MDYADWLARLRTFVNAWQARLPPERRSECYVHADPPLSPDQIRQLRDGLDCPLPPSIERFLTQAASRLRVHCICVQPGTAETVIAWDLFNYWFYSPQKLPYEEQFVGPLEGMMYSREVARALADHFEPECVLDRALWHHALPLAAFPTNDALALWAYDPELAEPPVIWLNHDDASFLLSPSFDEFLEQLERLGYDYGEEYRDPGTGLMDIDSPAAVARRSLLGLTH
jgi:hypothetical protein